MAETHDVVNELTVAVGELAEAARIENADERMPLVKRKMKVIATILKNSYSKVLSRVNDRPLDAEEKAMLDELRKSISRLTRKESHGRKVH